jgi:hypothetical protein
VKSKIQKRSNFNDFHLPKVKGKKRGKEKRAKFKYLVVIIV